MAAHTPGPWTLTWNHSERLAIVGPNNDGKFTSSDRICNLPHRRNGEGKANGRLIAAAPELLEAAREFTKAAHDARDALNAAGIPCPASIALAAEHARHAIAKAEGRT